MKYPQQADAQDKSQANSPVLSPWWGADGVNSVRLHLLVRSSKCGADQPPEVRSRGRISVLTATPVISKCFETC